MTTDYAARLAEANKRIKFTNIKGKEYAEVPQRVSVFYYLFPNGRIITELLSDDGNRCVFKASVYRDKDDVMPAAVGHAFEVKTGMINSTSYIENCETSAVGRALGFLGIGSETSIASADEVQNAIAQQESAKRTTTRKKAQSPVSEAPVASAPDALTRKTTIRRIRYKKDQAAERVPMETIDSWQHAYFGDRLPSQFTDEELAQYEAHLDKLIGA